MVEFQIMDVTCRDGSYVSNFQMSVSEEKNICKGLDEVGIPYIEIGHGMGLGASRKENRRALHTDDEYLECARCNIKKGKFGVFCIPGVATLEDVKKAASYGCSFIRVGSTVENVDETEPYIKTAKDCGMMVMSNYMKSYASSVENFIVNIKKSEQWGSEVVYIVDSAGGMMPEDIEKYYRAIRDTSNIKIGFHGHNNIGMAVANSLFAIELGVDIIDCSLQGLGRSAGNTVLEELVVCLQKRGIKHSIDEIRMMLLSQKYVYPMVRRRGISAIDLECGAAGFHSSYLPTIHRVSSRYEVNPLLLIKEYSKVDQVNMDECTLENIASSLPRNEDEMLMMDFEHYFGREQ